MVAEQPEVIWTKPARERLDLDPAPAQRPVHRRGLIADLVDLAGSWDAYVDENRARPDDDQIRTLRKRVQRADEETRAEARERALSLRASPRLSLRCLFSFVFPGEPSWSRADAEACLALPAVPSFAELLLASLGDAELARRLVEGLLRKETLKKPPLRALELVNALGARAVPALAILVSALEKDRRSHLRGVLDAVALVQTEEAAAIFTARLADDEVKQVATRYFRGAPALALRVLSPISSGGSKIARAAKARIDEVVAEHPALAQSTLPTLAAPARRAVAAARDRTEVRREEASAAQIPAILLRPPWRNKAARKVQVIEDLPAADVAPPVATVDDRDAWFARLGWLPLQSIFSPQAAHSVAHMFLHAPERRAGAEAWLRAFPEIAAAGIIPASVREPSPARLDAGRVLRFLTRIDRAAVDRVIACYTPPVRAVIASVLATDPLHDCPFTAPRLPGFVRIEALPRPILRASGHVLPREATRHLIEMLAFSPRTEPYAGIAVVREACEPASLEALAWALLEASLVGPKAPAWPMDALALVGGDDTARRLAPKIRDWRAHSHPKRAEAGVDVIADIGTDVALQHLSAIAERTRYADLQDHARRRLAEAAAARGLDADQLGDRTVPDLDLDPDGSKDLSYGARSFRVGFDEHLDPFVRSPEGEILRSLPRPLKSDDADKAKAAQEAWKALRTDVAAIAGGQIQRLEMAMVKRRRWSADEFCRVLVAHPLLFHLLRRLLFAEYDASGAPVTMGETPKPPARPVRLFRVAEDRSFADRDDAPMTLGEGTLVGLPHPLELDAGALSAWGTIFSDYELVQPFPQIGRETFTPTAEEREKLEMKRFNDARFESVRLFGLEYRGWRRESTAELSTSCTRALPGGLTALFFFGPGLSRQFVPGLSRQEVRNPPEQHLASLVVKGNQGLLIPPGGIDPILFSELCRDLAQLSG